MSNTDILSHGLPSSQEICRRMAVPFSLFFFVLAVLLLLSWTLLLPVFTQTEVYGKSMDIRSLVAYNKRLRAAVLEAQHVRNQLILPGQDPLFFALKQEKHRRVSFAALQEEIERFLRHAVPPEKGEVRVYALKYDAKQSALLVEGAVFAGMQSVTFLAHIADSLQNIPWVHAVELPVFRREQSDVGEFFAPFSFTIALDVAVVHSTFPVL